MQKALSKAFIEVNSKLLEQNKHQAQQRKNEMKTFRRSIRSPPSSTQSLCQINTLKIPWREFIEDRLCPQIVLQPQIIKHCRGRHSPCIKCFSAGLNQNRKSHSNLAIDNLGHIEHG